MAFGTPSFDLTLLITAFEGSFSGLGGGGSGTRSGSGGGGGGRSRSGGGGESGGRFRGGGLGCEGFGSRCGTLSLCQGFGDGGGSGSRHRLSHLVMGGNGLDQRNGADHEDSHPGQEGGTG